jgi:hypothetical protein
MGGCQRLCYDITDRVHAVCIPLCTELDFISLDFDSVTRSTHVLRLTARNYLTLYLTGSLAGKYPVLRYA